MAKRKGKGKERLNNKEDKAEDWCFECYDGGVLMICEYGDCLKAYHPTCVGRKNSRLTNDKPWKCGWHRCLECKRSSNYRCYLCPRAVCSRCIGRIEFVRRKGEFGFCNNCLKLALLWEEDKNVDSDGESVDFRDRDTHEGLFMEYYEIIKKNEGFDKSSLLAAKAQLDREKNIFHINSDSDEYIEEKDASSEEEDEQLASDNGDLNDEEPHKKGLKRKKCTHQKTKDSSKKREFVGWGSKALIDFLQYIGQDTREKLSQRDVTSIITNYAKEQNLFHPGKKKRIVCDIRLLAIFGKQEVNRKKIYNLLESHFFENVERMEEEEFDHDLEDNDTEMLAPKREKKLEQNKISLIKYSTAAQSQFAALIPQNIKLIYLKRSLVLEMIKQTPSFETKIIGSFVRVKLDPYDHKRSNSYQLVQVAGIKHGSNDNCNSEIFLQVSSMSTDVRVSMLSNDELSKEECDDLAEKVKAGLLKKLTIVELEQKAKILHEDITKHAIAQELVLLQRKIDQANEKGWRYELFRHMDRRKLIQQPSYLSFQLNNIPAVIPEEVELEPLVKDEKNGNQTHQCSDQTSCSNQNVPRLIPEEVELEPLVKDKKNANQSRQFSDESTLTKQSVPGLIPEEVELKPLATDRDDNQMRLCADETTAKQNVPSVIPTEEVELVLRGKAERDDNQVRRCSDEAMFPEFFT